MRIRENREARERTLVETQISKRHLLEQLGSLLEYPGTDPREMLPMTARRMETVSIQAADYLKDFFARMKRMELNMWQEFYVRTFDLMPQCPLYLSVHLFGEESFKRSQLMVGLKNSYEEKGALAMSELPDHLAVVLRHNALLDDEEWSELAAMGILPAIQIMISKLEKYSNPYALVLKTLQALLQEAEKVHV